MSLALEQGKRGNGGCYVRQQDSLMQAQNDPFDIDGDGYWVSVGPETIRLVIPCDDEEGETEYHCYTIESLKAAYEAGDKYARQAADLIDAYYVHVGSVSS